MRSVTFLALALLHLAVSQAQGASYPEPQHGDYVIRDFAFASGEVLPELKLHYVTIGSPVVNQTGVVTNAVLVLHGTGGSASGFLTEQFAGTLFSPGQPLDARRYYLILPDSIGAGKSSKPSDGLRGRFPHYTYDDMVRAQHHLVLDHLHVSHLRLILGTSMGGMHAWLWGGMYPDFMDALMPMACLPAPIAGRNRMQRRLITDAIRNDPEWRNGEYDKQPRGLISALQMNVISTASAEQLQRLAPDPSAADKLLDNLVNQRLATVDANDYLYQWDASRTYDPGAGLSKIQAAVVAINSADDEVNPPELGVMEREIARVRRGRYVLIPSGEKTIGHRTFYVTELWKALLPDLLQRPHGQ
jgi:homoserine O-acetyltransferase/O-succinyltransferase